VPDREPPQPPPASAAIAADLSTSNSSPLPSFAAILRIVLTVVAVVITLYVIYLLRTPLTWLFIATFLAIALSGPVAFLSRWMKRAFAIAIVYLGLLLFPLVLAGLFIPPLVKQANKLANNVPQYAQDLENYVNDNSTLRQLEEDYNFTEKIKEEAKKLPAKIGDAAGVLSDIGFGLVSRLFAVINILILSAFMLGGGAGWVEAFARRQPADRADAFRRLAARTRDAVSAYVAGALAQATVAGVTSFIVLTILGVPFATALAALIFVLDLIPLVGATIGAVVVGVVTVFNDFPTDTIIWVVFSIIYQQVENNVIQPRIQSRAVDVHPFVVLLSVLFGATLFGVLGALLAIPLAATLQIAAREYLRYREATRAAEIARPAPPAAPGPAAPAAS
jgi:predicted PurR-regulated permease PerM